MTGNPIRREFFEISKKQRDAARFSLLVFGGSQGARAINDALIGALQYLAPQKNRLHLVHQTGEADYDKVKQGYEAASWHDRSDVRRYIDNMMEEFSKADLVICRAGATTTAELIAAGKGAIMIPLPLAADDHQRKNAEALQTVGAARMILQKDLSGERLANEVSLLLDAPEKIEEMEIASRKLARRDAAAATVDLMEEVVQKGSRIRKTDHLSFVI